jgi:hypothetical protein
MLTIIVLVGKPARSVKVLHLEQEIAAIEPSLNDSRNPNEQQTPHYHVRDVA